MLPVYGPGFRPEGYSGMVGEGPVEGFAPAAGALPVWAWVIGGLVLYLMLRGRS